MRSSDCPYTVHFYGALFREGDVWICMEVMDTSLDKFYPKVYKHNLIFNEDILGKVSSRWNAHKQCTFWVFVLWVGKSFPKTTKNQRRLEDFILQNNYLLVAFDFQIVVAVVNALYYLHAQLHVIHRDVKPSNILINRKGEVKMCDFGISGIVLMKDATSV